LKSHQPAPVPLVGSGIGPRAAEIREALRFAMPRAPLDTGRLLAVMPLRFGGRTTRSC
jgi:hypothetical protein